MLNLSLSLSLFKFFCDFVVRSATPDLVYFFIDGQHKPYNNQIGRRFSALNADKDLEASNFYLMFPMKRLNSVINAADLGPLFLAAKKISSGGRIVRVALEPEKEEDADVGDGLAAKFMKCRLPMCRSRKPLLETIVEEPV